MLRRGERDGFASTWLPLLDAGGVGLQLCPVLVDPARQPEATLREALAQVTAFHAAAAEQPGRVVVVRGADDLDAAAGPGRIGLVLALEGVEPFGHELWAADLFHLLGVRVASLTWNQRNAFADGVAEERGGLSGLGRALVDRLVGLGVVLDLAHASTGTFREVLERVGDAPVLCSHAGCRAVHDHPRNLDDEQLRDLAAAGGVLGVMLHPLAVGAGQPTIDRAIDHLEHAVAVMGETRVGLGGDFGRRLARALGHAPASADGLLPDGLAPDAALDGLAGPQDYPALAARLFERGWEEKAVDRVLYGNLTAFLRRALA